MDRRFLTILAVLVVIFIGVFAFSKHSSNKTSTNSTTTVSTGTNHVTGQGKAGVTLIEYGDYQCPVCEIYYQPLKQVTTQFNQDIYFQFANLPLPSLHPNAFAAARAAEAAGLQNKYFQMHDKLYEDQSAWVQSSNPLDVFKSFAASLGLNVDQFVGDYSSSKVNDAINSDTDAFNKTKQEVATPTFFLDGRYIPNTQLVDPQTGAPSVSKFTDLLNAEITKKKSSATSNTTSTKQ